MIIQYTNFHIYVYLPGPSPFAPWIFTCSKSHISRLWCLCVGCFQNQIEIYKREVRGLSLYCFDQNLILAKAKAPNPKRAWRVLRSRGPKVHVDQIFIWLNSCSSYVTQPVCPGTIGRYSISIGGTEHKLCHTACVSTGETEYHVPLTRTHGILSCTNDRYANTFAVEARKPLYICIRIGLNNTR